MQDCKRIGFTLLVFLLATFSSAVAQSERGFTFGGGAGVSLPSDHLGKEVDTGFNINARGGYNPSRHLGLDLDFLYNHWGLNNTALARLNEPGGSVSIWSVTFNPVYRLAPRHRIDPYITAGFGVYSRSLTLTQPALINTFACDPFFGCFPAAIAVNQVIASNTTYKGGWNAGGGIDFRLGEGKMKVFAEARWQNMFTTHGSDLNYIPVTFGIRW